MPTIASVTVKCSRKYQVRRDDWVNLEAMITLTVSAEEAHLTDPYEVTAEAFAIARQSVKAQATDLRRQFTEAQRPAAPAAHEPPIAISTVQHNGTPPAPATSEPPFTR